MRWQDDGSTVHIWVDGDGDVRLDLEGRRLELRVRDAIVCDGTLFADVSGADWSCEAGSVHVQLRKTSHARWARCFRKKKKPRFTETILDPDTSPAPTPSTNIFYGTPVCDSNGAWSIVPATG